MQIATGQPLRENQTGKSPANPGRFTCAIDLVGLYKRLYGYHFV